MKFHAVLLYIDDQFPDISIFRKLQEVGRGLYPKGAYLYSVEQKLICLLYTSTAPDGLRGTDPMLYSMR